MSRQRFLAQLQAVELAKLLGGSSTNRQGDRISGDQMLGLIGVRV